MSDSAPGLLTGDVEADERYAGGKPRYKGQSKRGRGTIEIPVLALVERTGSVKIKPIPNVTGKSLKQAIRDDVHTDARIIYDENPA